MTLMFADMRGFTRLCQTVRNDEHICKVIADFLSMLADEVLGHGGMVNKKLGDGVLALFRQEDSARKAVACAFRMEDRFRELHLKWTAFVPERIAFLDIGIGIVTAPVMVGAIGTGNMRDFTAIGTPVILAAALEKQARNGRRILSDKDTYFAVRDLVDDESDPVEFPLHKPDQPTITSYDQYHLVRRGTAPPKTTPTIRVFLCHASDDKPRVRELYEQLRSDGIEPWLDERSLEPGAEWEQIIPDAVRDCRFVLVCLSGRSVLKAGYVQREIKLALDVADEKPEGSIFIIPVRLDDCETPKRLRRWQCVDLFESDGYRRLVRSMHAQGDL